MHQALSVRSNSASWPLGLSMHGDRNAAIATAAAAGTQCGHAFKVVYSPPGKTSEQSRSGKRHNRRSKPSMHLIRKEQLLPCPLPSYAFHNQRTEHARKQEADKAATSEQSSQEKLLSPHSSHTRTPTLIKQHTCSFQCRLSLTVFCSATLLSDAQSL